MAFLLALACGPARAEAAPTAEFDTPYQLRVLSDGAVLEVSGSFSWALPQNFQAVLAGAPQVRMVRFESPGGHIQPAMEVAAIIRQRGFDTYVGRFCASACTLAFLAGDQRWLAPNARLGFHQAHAPGFPPAEANALLGQAYAKFAIPAPFIAHVLRTPPADLWFPTPDELRAARITTSAPPASVAALDDGQSSNLRDIARLLPVAPDGALIQFAMVLSDLLGRLADVDPQACWAFAHDGSADLNSLVPRNVLDAVAAAEQRIAEAASTTPTTALDAEERKIAAADLMRAIRANGQAAALDGLRPGADPASFCPSLRIVLLAALALPEPQRVRGLRAVLSGGR